MKFIANILLFIFTWHFTEGQSIYYPPNGSNTWETIDPSTLHWCSDRIDRLYHFLDSTNSKAFILLKDGKIVLEKYFDNFTADSLWLWNSAGKTLTGLTIGIAQQEGLLNIDDKTSHYLGNGWTSCTADQESKITIKNQITMTTGLDDGIANSDCTAPSCFVYKADAGTRWAYHNGPYTILDKVIAAATNQTLNAYVNSKILNPIGMQGVYYKFGDNNIFISKARSMARFGLLLLAQGDWNGKAILKDKNYFAAMTNSSQSINPSYGYLTWLNGKSKYMLPTLQFQFQGSLNKNAPSDLFAALGKNGQLINISPSQNIVFIRMGEAPSTTSLVPNVYNNDIWIRINELNCTTATNDFSNDDFIINQNDNELFINQKNNSNENKQITLYNSNGTIITSESFNSDFYSVRIPSIVAGIYFIKITSKHNSFTKKICWE